MKPTIGILGGMGPRATVEFEKLLIDSIPGNDQDIPTIITINDGGIPDRSAYILGYGVDPLPRLQKNLDILERSGAQVICLPCNTACTPAIFNRLKTRSAHIINLPYEVNKYLLEANISRVYVMATKGTIKAGVYKGNYQNHLDCIEPTSIEQLMVDNVIRYIKSGNMDCAKIMAERLKKIVIAQKCDGVMLGCTELPLLSPYLVPEGSCTIDTLAVLVRACLNYVDVNSKRRLYDTRSIYA